MNSMLVSIIIPLYNTEKYIAETMQSVVNQTYTNWELIVVNDGSTDNSASIVSSFIEKDKRISLINKPNSGVSDTRNKGIEHAKGEYIAFLDADDTWETTNLEEKINLLTSDNIDWVFSDAALVNEQTEKIGKKLGNDESMLTHYLLWDRTVVPGPCSNILMKCICIENHLFDSNFSTAADQDFAFYLTSNFKGKQIPKELWNYRNLPNSMSKNIAVMEKDHIGVYKKAKNDGLFHSFWFKQKCFSNLYLILAGSWWKDGNNKLRGVWFIVKALFTYPPSVMKVIKRVFKCTSTLREPQCAKCENKL